MKNGRTMLKLFLSYILLVIPMVVISFLVANAMTSGMRRRLDQRIEREILQIEQELNDQLVSYKNNAVKISTIEQLSPDKFLGRGEAARQGIEYLGNIKMMDNFLDDILLCYRKEIFIANGYCRPETYFGITLKCEEDVVALGNRILQEERETMVYLSSPDGGYLFFHYPVANQRGMTKEDGVSSINYCVKSEKIYSLLESLTEEMAFRIHITFENEWQTEEVYLAGNMEEGTREVSAEEYKALQADEDWTVREVNLELWGMKLKVAYDAGQLYEQVRFWQRMNMVSMGILLLCSVLISYWISRNQYEKIYRLRESLQTIWKTDETGLQEKPKNEFDYMHTMIQSIVQETGRMRQETDNARRLMRQQGAMLLFYGGIREESAAQGMLESCGLELQDPFFAVVCITPTENRKLSAKLLEWLSEERLTCTGNVGGRMTAIVLLELSNEDYAKKQREKFAEAVFAEEGGEVKIAFSRTYENILRASGAYLEAAVICESLQQMTGEYCGYADTWMDMKQQMVRFGEEDLTELENSVADGQRERAQKALETLLAFLRNRTLTEENRKYLRYCIIQSILLSSKNMEKKNIRVLSEEITGIDLNDDRTFADKIRRVLNQSCPVESGEERKKTEFAKIVEYIGINYQRYDLSLEEVADYAGLSKAYLSRLFKEKTGSKYIEYLTACRMEQAKRMLLETNLSVKQIAEAVGYINVPGFRNKFKSYFGINASEIRRKYRSGTALEEQGEEQDV